MTVVENAPAKINLGLKIIGKRTDGYHNIRSIFQTIDIYDELEITSSHKPGLVCSHPEVPTGSENLVLKAENLLRKRFRTLPEVHFTLKKRIPVGAGLAGGSSDAAAALRGLNSFHNLNVPDNVLSEYACELGSDVPFLIKGGTSVVSGRGEIIVEVEWPFNFTYVIVYPKFAVSTSWAYRNLNNIRYDYAGYKIITEKLIVSKLEKDEFFDVLKNDFEEPVFKKYPILSKIKSDIINNGPLKAILTGSGSSILGIFEDDAKAFRCANIFKDSEFEIFIAKASTKI